MLASAQAHPLILHLLCNTELRILSRKRGPAGPAGVGGPNVHHVEGGHRHFAVRDHQGLCEQRTRGAAVEWEKGRVESIYVG